MESLGYSLEYPAGEGRLNNVVSTSMRRHAVNTAFVVLRLCACLDTYDLST